MDFQVADYKGDGAIVKKYGYFVWDTDAVFKWRGGVLGEIVLSGFTVGIPPYLGVAAETLAKAGFENIREAQVSEMARGDPGISNDEQEDKGIVGKLRVYFNKLLRRGGVIEKMEDAGIVLNYYVLRNFMLYNATPSANQKLIESEKAKYAQKLQRQGVGITINHAIIIFIILIAFGVVYLLIQQGGMGGAAQAIGQGAAQAGEGINL